MDNKNETTDQGLICAFDLDGKAKAGVKAEVRVIHSFKPIATMSRQPLTTRICLIFLI